MERTLSEVYAVVLAMGKEYQIRIPDDVWMTIKEKSDEKYTPFIDENKELKDQNISHDAITFIAMLRRDYWCESEEERQDLIKFFQENEERFNKKLISSTSTKELLRLLKNNK